MKRLRLWLLVVLAVLLPVRGALAAAVLCAPAGSPAHAQGADLQHGADLHPGSADEHAAHAAHHAAHTGDGHVGSAAAHADGADGCNLCSASCSGAPLPSAAAAAPSCGDAASAAFPQFSAPPPSFLSDGPERPPRSA